MPVALINIRRPAPLNLERAFPEPHSGIQVAERGTARILLLCWHQDTHLLTR